MLETNPGNERNNEIREQISGEETIVPGDNPIKDKTPSPPAAHDPNISMSVQGLQGLFTTIQGTIASLQSTVVALQHKQSDDSSTSTNQLDKFYNNLQQQQSTIPTAVSQYGIPALNTAPAQNASTQHGVPADSLPHIDVITESVRKNITAGKYVNLATLLIPDMDTKVPENLGALEFLKRQQKDHRLDRPLNIMQFYRAFGIYKRVMCEAYPQRRAELDLYEADIGDIYDHYGEVFLSISCPILQESGRLYGERNQGRLVQTS